MFHRRLLARALIALVATATVFGGGEAEPEDAAAGAGGAAQQALTAAADQWPNAAFKTGDFVYATPADFTEATGHEITSYQEAPELTARVTSGEIPPVEQRLPKEPLVLVPMEKVGQYGGSMRVGSVGFTGWTDFTDARWPGLLRYSADTAQVLPYLTKGYELSADGKTLTLHFRKDHKWSDGSPFTLEDVLFWWEDQILNDELTPTKPARWKSGGELAQFEKIDDTTLRIRFAESNPAAVFTIAHHGGRQNAFYQPSEYLKNWHIEHNSEANAVAKKEGYDTWWEAFNFHRTYGPQQTDTGLPVVAAWALDTVAPTHRTFVRNPYYLAVDTAGNQLPYIDSITRSLVGDAETLKLQVVAGEFDINWREVSGDDYPLLLKNQESAGYRVALVKYPGHLVYVAFNQNSKDPAKREIFQNVAFRRAMSMAINRDEINEIVFAGQGVPSAVTPDASTSFYKQGWESAWAQFDPDHANRLLDEIGLAERDDSGFRLRPDGEKLVVIIEYQERGPRTPTLELIKEYWDAVGVQTELKPLERTFYFTRINAAEHDVGVWHLDAALEGPLLASKNKSLNFGSTTGPGKEWIKWRDTQGQSGEEPPEEVKEWFEGTDKFVVLPQGSPEYIELGQELFDWFIDQVNLIGTVTDIRQPIVLNKDLRNVALDQGVYTWDSLYVYSYLPEVWFFDN